jgi:hypothetical protein
MAAEVPLKQRPTLVRALPLFAVLAATLALPACARPEKADAASSPLSIDVGNRRKIEALAGPGGAATYAKENQYYAFAANRLKAGMTVMFSASYGAGGGEAGQSRGKLVEKDGGLYYRQEENPTLQLLLPPGLAFASSATGTSLWEMRSYLDLINRVAFNDAPKYASDSSAAASNVYADLSAFTVDFDGGTASSSVAYKDALELKLTRANRDDSRSDLSVYFARGVGAVALEFRETGPVGGTFKVYIGDEAH